MTAPLLLAIQLAAAPASGVVEAYVERYFEHYPTRATQAGRHDRDRELEDLSVERRSAWARFNRETREALKSRLAEGLADADDRLDAEALLAQVEREVHEIEVLDRPGRDPLYWSGPLSEAAVFLLLRDDRPLAERLSAARSRIALAPRLARQASEALATTTLDRAAPELARLAAGQLRASAVFYRDGLPKAAPDGATAEELRRVGGAAAAALEGLAAFLDERATRATGSPRLGADYATAFRLYTGIEASLEDVLAGAEADLQARRHEAAAYGRTVWAELMPGQTAPADDRALLRRLFARVEDDHDTTFEQYLNGWKTNLAELDAFVRARGVITLPDPLTLAIDRSPGFFVGQSVGGVHSPGPWAPEARTLLLLPTPPDDAAPAQREALYRAFNRPFNRMIAPHELVPGHYLQAKSAARHPRKARALFADPVYVEGWGTFCERLMLDLGWGGPLPRLAHLKKQLENAARLVVDIRVHARGMTREEVARFLREEALQDEQLAANMWTRAITTAPQLTSYHLGYRQVMDLYEDVRRARGKGFELRAFMDGMLELGPVPVRHYRERLLR